MSDPSSSDLGSGSSLSFTTDRVPGRIRRLSSPTPPGRLTSLRTRDLTLGGVLKKPKTFEPNVHAVRKSKDELKEDVHMAPKKERRERDRRRRENKGGRKRETIQSHSIFEQGPADSVCKTGWFGAQHLLDTTTPPVYDLVKKEWKESKDCEDEILSKLQRDDFIYDPGLVNDDKLKPIQLPLSRSSSLSKSRLLMPSTCPESSASCGAQSRADHSETGQPSLVEILQDLRLSDREELFLMQLPDCMPSRVSQRKIDPTFESSADRPARKEGKSGDKRPAPVQTQGAVVKEACSVLSQSPEGLLGKLQIRQSGKVQLKLGGIVMDVSEGAAFSFLQQLVCVRLSDGQTGDMMMFGNVHHKLVLSPDFQALLRQAQAQQGPR